MDEIRGLGSSLFEALSRLDSRTRLSVTRLTEMICECSLVSARYIEEIRELQPDFFNTEINEDITKEIKELIVKYNIECDKTTTLIGMIPSEEIRSLLKFPVKIIL